jgi:GNAT superfamily N-acetyltransferase
MTAMYYISICPKPQVAAHFKGLTPEARRTRFCSQISDESIDKYVENAKGTFYGVFVFDDFLGSRVPVSVLHYCPLWEAKNFYTDFIEGKKRIAEVAFSTLPDHQKKGFAKVLMFFVKGLAEFDMVDTLIMSGLAENKSIQKMAKGAGFDVKTDYDEFEAHMKTWRAKRMELGESWIQLVKAPWSVIGDSNVDKST